MRISTNSVSPSVSPASTGSALSRTETTDAATFETMLGKALDSVEEKNQEANASVVNMLNGTADVHNTMLALHEAEEAIELTLAVRNKFVQAYQDIMRMSL